MNNHAIMFHRFSANDQYNLQTRRIPTGHKFERVKLNHATTQHDPPPSPTTNHPPSITTHHPPPSTTTHNQPKYIHHHPQTAKILSLPQPRKWTNTL